MLLRLRTRQVLDGSAFNEHGRAQLIPFTYLIKMALAEFTQTFLQMAAVTLLFMAGGTVAQSTSTGGE